MQSLVIYGNEFDGHLSDGLMPQAYKYRFLVEGDSWMDRSSMFHTSLLQQLAREFDRTHESVLFINLAMFGDTMRRIGECADDELRLWINTQFNWMFDAVLLSAGGNDYIDAARDPAPGMGILRSFVAMQPPTNAEQCVNKEALAKLVTQYLDPNFNVLYNQLRASHVGAAPIFLNFYDTPVARNAPAFPGGKAWLFEAYTKNGIPTDVWPELTDYIFNDLQTTVAGWTKDQENIHIVQTNNTLNPAQSYATGSSGDWLNEIHPNESGWRKLSAVWREAIKTAI